MIVTKNKLIFIDNPKCASTTMRNYYEQIRDDILFQSSLNISQCKGLFHNPNYVHTNAAGIFKYLELTSGGSIDEFTCFTTIRNPYNRFLSHYNYFLKMNEQKHPIEDLSVEKFMDRTMTRACFPENFRCFQDFKVTNLIKVENLNDDLNKFNQMYNIGFTISGDKRLNSNKVRDKNFKFTTEIVNFIDKNYELDFVEGGYSKKSPKELNEQLSES